VPALNGAVVNVYESDRAKIGWHADDEFHLGPVVCTLSLGRPQTMEFRARDAPSALPQAAIELEHDSLLMMGAGTQEFYLHRILPASPQQRARGPCRISITFHHHRLDLLEKLQPEPADGERA
jgi:alkylated DNA repair dioxygenase AlkB